MYNFVSGHDCSVYRNLLRRDQNSYTSGVILINAQAIHFHQLVPRPSSHQSYVLLVKATHIFAFCHITIIDKRQLNLVAWRISWE